MGFKEALGIEDTSWVSINKHLGRVIQTALQEHRKTEKDLADYLIQQGHDNIQVGYVKEYLDPKAEACIGVFFYAAREFLQIPATVIFPTSASDDTENHLNALEAYLTEISPETLEHFLMYKPGEELRKHVASVCIEKREKGLKYFEGDFDKFIVEQTNQLLKTRGLAITLEDWKNLYQRGFFNSLTNGWQIADLAFMFSFKGIPFGIDSLVPTRELTDAEKYEIHQRWTLCGGESRPGATQAQLKTFLEGKLPQSKECPQHVKYEVDSKMALVTPLAFDLPRLLKRGL